MFELAARSELLMLLIMYCYYRFHTDYTDDIQNSVKIFVALT